jgi:hypothetical protein
MSKPARAAEHAMEPARFHIDLHAAEYLTVLQRLHTTLQPETYLEIGTRHGDSLRLAQCRSIAVDPLFDLKGDVLRGKPSCHFFQITSDRFFRNHNAETVLGGKVELAYIDGMHLAEFLLREILNIEKHCRRSSIIVLHDCIPSDIHMACRTEGDEARARSVVPDWWTGDVWKAVWALQKHRPDLRVVGIDSPPTGLVCLTNLDPSSTTLESQYGAIVDEMTALGDDETILQRYIEALAPIKPSALERFADIARYFHL